MGLFSSPTPSLPTPIPAFLPANSLTPSLRSFIDLLPTAYDVDAFTSWYKNGDPLHPALAFATGMSVLVWLLGEITGNVSQVDRLWTFLPIIYATHFTFFPLLSTSTSLNLETISTLDPRMLLVFGLQLTWSARLTTNTYRRGFFNPRSEDYRWEVVRDIIPVWAFKILNFAFIAFIQNFLLLAAELPVYLLLVQSSSAAPTPPLNFADYGLAATFLAILVVEMVADNQQQKYQNFKVAVKEGKKAARTKEEMGMLERGFITTGLWSWSRHPNFACEQATWYILYLFTVLPFLPPVSDLFPSLYPQTVAFFDALPSVLKTLPSYLPADYSTFFQVDLPLFVKETVPHFIQHDLAAQAERLDLVGTLKSTEGVWWNYSVWAPLSMSALFLGSTTLTELISAGKYPLYKSYQRRVGMFLPTETVGKGVWLALTRNKAQVERKVWGSGTAAGKQRAKAE